MPIHCLIIDDDEDDRDFFEIALADCGHAYLCSTAPSGTDALLLLPHHVTPDFIFLDLNMPMVSGKECLQQIRRLEVLNHVPIVIYSTSSYHKDIEDARQLGASYFLSKTADINRLSQILSQLFSRAELPFVLS
jgi:CheY-like chemotaxis protein